jgi:hypothetical protein
MPPIRARRLAVVPLFAALCLGAAPAAADWKFAIPPGWTDLSPGKPVSEDVPEAVTAVTQNGVYHTYAMDLAGAKGGFGTNLNAIVRPGALVADDRALASFVSSLPEQVRNEIPDAKVAVVEQSIAPIGGVPSLRVVVDLRTDDLALRVLRYTLPGGKEVAALTYTSTAKDFDRYLPAFEAAARQTRGVQAAPAAARIGARLRQMGGDSLSDDDWVKIFGLGGKIVGALVAVGLFSFVSRRFGKKKQPAPGTWQQ